MKALSILQPWAWLILHAGKDIENRTWRHSHRGPTLIHAGKTWPKWMYPHQAEDFLTKYGIKLPSYDEIQRGGIVGQVDIVDCVLEHPSRWKDPAAWGFVLANPRPMEFRPLRGQLGFFEVSY